MVEYTPGSDEACGRLVLRPNQSLGWSGNRRFWQACVLVSGSIAVFWAWLGAFPILIFSFVELSLLYWGLHRVNRQCFLLEMVELSQDAVRIQRGIKGPEQVWEFQRFSTQVEIKQQRALSGDRRCVRLRCRDQILEVGAFLSEEEKREVIGHLTSMVAHYRVNYLSRG